MSEAYILLNVNYKDKQRIIEEAKNIGCYKLIACSRYSRPQIHEWYKKLGFEDYGKEFKIKLTNN